MIGLLLLCSASASDPAPPGAGGPGETRGIPALDRACPESPGGVPGPIQIVGVFTDMRSTGEHAYGYRVELWRQGRRPFGLFMASQGLAGDTPAGLLEDVEFDSGTGRMAFRARLTMGLFSSRRYRNVPSRDVFQFAGTLSLDTLRGVLDVSNALTPEQAPRREAVVLRRSAEESQGMSAPRSCSEWLEGVAAILKFRGPKW